MNFVKSQAAFIAFTAGCVGLPARAQNIKPGSYEYTTVTEMMGMKIPMNFKQCVTQKDIDSNQAYANQRGADGCMTPEVKRSGSAITVKFSCTKPKMTGSGSGTVSDTQFSMQMKVIQHEMGDSVLNTQLIAKRLGDC